MRAVGIASLWRRGAPDHVFPSAALAVPTPGPGASRGAQRLFAVGDDYSTWQALINGENTGQISRSEASSVPAVKRARDLIAGTLGTLPLHAINSAGEQVEHPLLTQPEAPLGLVRCVTITKTVEDLLYDGASLWLVLLRTSQGFPQAVQRIDYGKWTQDADTRAIRVNGREVDPKDLIVFTSPNDALLKAGARAIRALLLLEQTAAMYADEPEPTAFFTAADGADPDEDYVKDVLTRWKAARKARKTAWVPNGLTYNQAKRMTPEELELISARQHAVLEVARLTGVDAEELSVSTTSRTYSNQIDRRKAFLDFTLAPYRNAIEERLSLGDVTPRGQTVRFNVDAFLRSDTKSRYEAHKIGLESGFLTLPEVREMENRAPLEATK